MTHRYKVAYLVSHPIQYQAPLLRYITSNSDIDLTAFFLSDFSVRGYQDKGFGAKVEWDVPLLEGYKSVFLPAFGSRARITPLRPYVHGIARHLKSGGFDALWMHGYAHQANLRAMMIAKRLGIKVFVRAESQLGAVGRTKANRRLKETIIQALFAQVDAFLAIGTLNRNYYRHYGVPDTRIFSVPYAVDNAFFQARAHEASAQRDALRAELNLAPARPVILYASKLQARKRAGDLLEAYIKLSTDGKQEPRPYLLYVGDGEDRAMLEARAYATGWNSIRFLGFKNQTELPRYFDLCDLFVLVSQREPWGLIVNEVMNAGKPIVISDQAGCSPDLVRDGENGYIVQVGDISTLRDKLQLLTAQPETACRMGARSLEIIDRWGFREDLAGLTQALAAMSIERAKR